MNLPTIDELKVSEKRVIVRLDLDVTNDFTRIEASKKTLNLLADNKAKIVIIGHKGRPGGEYSKELSLGPLKEVINNLLSIDVDFVEGAVDEKVVKKIRGKKDSRVLMLDNLRFNNGERENSKEFAGELVEATGADLYINEAFAVSHREHASIVGIPKLLPHAAGFRFVQEIKHLSRVIEKPERPLLFLISGIKKDKVDMIKRIRNKADKVLVAGRLPEYLGDIYDDDEKVLVAQLNPDKKDITKGSIKEFEREIEKASTIVLAGVIGKYEDEDQREGTKRIFEKVASSSAYKVAGGGDTETALSMFKLTGKFDWISVGGGAALEFMAKGTLPGIEALR